MKIVISIVQQMRQHTLMKLLLLSLRSKPQDLAFHKRFYQFKHGIEWISEKIRSERGMLQYIQCEPRELVEIYCSSAHKKFMQHCYETRNEMQEKIKTRDAKRHDGVA